MSWPDLNALGLSGRTFDAGPRPIVRVQPDRSLRAVLAFTGRTIDDVVNSSVVKNEVLGYSKLRCDVRRRSQAVDLNRWWAGVGRRPRP